MSISRLAANLVQGFKRPIHTTLETPGHLAHTIPCEKIPEIACRALVTGATGRLGQTLMPELHKRNIVSICATRSSPRSEDQMRLTYKETADEMARCIKLHNIDVVVHAAAASSGSFEEMLDSNTKVTLRLAEAAKKAGARFVQVSTTATQIPGITQEKPYAFTKRLAEQRLTDNDHASIARLDALVGDASKPSLEVLAGVGRVMPMSVQLHGADPTIQPTTYEAASKALAAFVEMVARRDTGEEIIKEVNIAGHPIKISEFIRLVSNSKFEVHLPIASLEGLAKLVNDGALTPEFLKLAVRSAENPVIFDTKDFEGLHGSPIPTVEDVAAKVHETVTAQSLFSTAKKILGKAPASALLAKTGNAFQGARILTTF